MRSPPVLLVIDGDAPAPEAFTRALALAHFLHAPLHTLLYATEHRLRSRKDASQTHGDLETLRDALHAPACDMTADLIQGSSMSEALQAYGAGPLAAPVIPRAHSEHALLESCPAPMLVTAGRPWATPPCFAAAADVLAPDGTLVTGGIVRAAATLQKVFAASLDLIYVGSGNGRLEAPEGESPAQLTLGQLASGEHIDARHLHELRGDAAHVLSRFIGTHRYDLLVIGAPHPRRGLWRRSGSRLGSTALECDLLILRPEQSLVPSALSAPHDVAGRTAARAGTRVP